MPREGVAEVVQRGGGRAERADLLRHATPAQIRAALRLGDVQSAARGIYVLPQLPDDLALAAACRGVLSHESAAQRLGLGLVFPPSAVHVTAGRGARPKPRKQVILHRRQLAHGEIDGPLTTPLRTVLDCCVSLPFREALAVADSAARMIPGFADQFLLSAAAAGPGRARRLRVARFVSGLAANPFESALRGGLIEAGLTGFTPQVTIVVKGRSYRVDLADRKHRLVLEADSFTWHGDRRALAEDCRRYNDLVGDDWRVLRFAWEHVMYEMPWAIDTVQACLAAPNSPQP